MLGRIEQRKCGQKVSAFARLLHQTITSRALVSTSSRERFHTQARPLGFTAPAVRSARDPEPTSAELWVRSSA
jgi:hypothetical protein